MGGGSSEPEKEQKQNQYAQNKDKKVTIKNKNFSPQININSPKKKIQQKTKNSTKQQENINQDDSNPSLNLKLPLCVNKRKATHICLYSNCTKYPFFCLQCEFLCEENHHHGKRLNSISFKEFQKRLAKSRTVSSELQQAEGSYNQSFDDFYENQLGFLEEIEIRKSLSSEAIIVKAKIQKNQKSDLSGRKISQLWKQSASWPEEEGQILGFLTKKKQLMVNLLETFENINKMNRSTSNQSSLNKDIKSSCPSKSLSISAYDKKTIHLFNRYELNSQKIQLCKQKNWNSSKLSIK